MSARDCSESISSYREEVVKIDNPAVLGLGQRLKFLARDSTMYGGAAAISRGFALITFPLLARHFSVAEYGVLDYFLVLGGFLATMAIFGQDSAVARFFYEYEETSKRRQVISQSLVFQLAFLSVLLAILWFGAGRLVNLLIETPNRLTFFKIVLLQLPFYLLINFSQNILKWTFARARFLTMSLGFSMLHVTLLVIAVLVFDAGIRGVLLVSLATSSVFGCLGLFFVRKWLVRPKDLRRLREMLPFAIPYGVICVIGAFSPAMERTLTNSLLGTEQMGLYAAAAKIAMIIMLAASAFQIAWGPFSLSLYKQVDAARTYNWVLKLFALGMCVAALSLTLLAAPLIHFLASARYSGAVWAVFPLVMGLAIQTTSWITEIGISISKRSYLSLYSHTTFIGATLLGIWLFAPAFGILGVGLGVLLGQTAKTLIASWLAQRAYPLPWKYRPVILLVAATLLFGLAATWLGRQFGPLVYQLGLATGLITIILLGWTALLDKTERVQIIAFVRKRVAARA